MCGIAGIWNHQAEFESAAAVARMLDAMQHRGPDGQGSLQFEGGAAGMVRLALVDLSERGQQPLWSSDGRVAIVFNGEIYNFRPERQRLLGLGYPFRSTTDTEVILNLYLERGLEFVERLRGMYALAIFDWRETGAGELPVMVLARGPLGIKPLYIGHPQGRTDAVVFASELRGMLASGLIPRRIDRQGLLDYLAHGFVLQPHTMIEGVRMMEPGEMQVYRPGRTVAARRFWQVPGYAPREETLDEAAERLRSVLDESVKLHALADAPVGAFLSGGVDSTGIVGLMRKHVPDLRTYTLRFPEFPRNDESQEAAAAAAAFEVHNTIVNVTGAEVAALLPRFAGELDQPSADGLNTWMISRAAAREVKGVLSGVGGDEWFAGYPVTRRMARSQTTWRGRFERLAGRLAHVFDDQLPASRWQSRMESLAQRRSPLALWLQSHTVFKHARAQRWIGMNQGPTAQQIEFEGLLDNIRDDWREESMVGLSCLLDARVYMLNQLLRDSDASSMAHSLELRVPLVDLEVVNFTRTCRDDYKIRRDGGSSDRYASTGSKRVLIQALEDVMPATVANRPKRGFAMPMAYWMQHEIAPLVEETCSPDSVARRGLIDPQAVAPLWSAARAGAKGDLYPRLWTMMILELWCRAVLDSPPSSPHLRDASASARK